MKTKEEIQKLKENWLNDPCYDIEQVEGFEEHRQELYIYRLEHEKKWLQERLIKYDKLRQMIRDWIF